MNEFSEHGPVSDPALGDSAPDESSEPGPSRPPEAEEAGSELARGAESEQGDDAA